MTLCSIYMYGMLFSFLSGGSVSSGLGIYDTMQYIQPPVSTWCVGQCCSMASLLLAAGTKGMRYSLPNAKIMVHQPSGGFSVSIHYSKTCLKGLLKKTKQRS